MPQKITQMHLESLKYNCCDRCGEVHPVGEGLFAMLRRPCYGNRVQYKMYVGSGFLKVMKQAIAGLYGEQNVTSMTPLYLLLEDQKYMRAMPDFDTASNFDKKVYYWLRQDEIKHMLRMQKLVKHEEEFFYSY
jgi:hypothetical protein